MNILMLLVGVYMIIKSLYRSIMKWIEKRKKAKFEKLVRVSDAHRKDIINKLLKVNKKRCLAKETVKPQCESPKIQGQPGHQSK